MTAHIAPDKQCTNQIRSLYRFDLAVTGKVLPPQPGRLHGTQLNPAAASIVCAHGKEKSTIMVHATGW